MITSFREQHSSQLLRVPINGDSSITQRILNRFLAFSILKIIFRFIHIALRVIIRNEL